MRKKLLFFRKSVVQCQSKILVSMFSGKDNYVFLRNVTRCYAKKIVVQTFSIVLPSYTKARVIQEICLVGVNVQNFSFFRTSKKRVKK